MILAQNFGSFNDLTQWQNIAFSQALAITLTTGLCLHCIFLLSYNLYIVVVESFTPTLLKSSLTSDQTFNSPYLSSPCPSECIWDPPVSHISMSRIGVYLTCFICLNKMEPILLLYLCEGCPCIMCVKNLSLFNRSNKIKGMWLHWIEEPNPPNHPQTMI